MVRRIGWEAWLTPATFALDRPKHSGLRRKLRRAEAAGLRVHAFFGNAVAPLPIGAAPPTGLRWQDLDRIAHAWRLAHGAERGFSMGRHERAHLAEQRLYVAYLDTRPVAYVSFHQGQGEWTLDLMRHLADLPDGTMHSLVTAAIADARRLGIDRLSLAAVPEAAITPPQDRLGRLIAAIAPPTAAAGLFRFKSAFAPHWRPLYLAAGSRAALAIAGLSLWRAITRPPPIAAHPMQDFEQDHAEYAFASVPRPWHIETGPD